MIQDEIERLKRERNAVILAHTYQPAQIQECADYVGDSYGLSVEAVKVEASLIIFCGVRFMAETAAILNPSRKVILPEPDAGCPMADMISADDLVKLKNRYPDHLVMCYVNSTAQIKALSDVCCTSSNAERIARKLSQGRGIIFVPDRHLGSWVAERTARDMVLWEGYCPVHNTIIPSMLHEARREHPDAVILIHPEAPHECRILADEVLSTGGMCDFAAKSDALEFVIATERGIIYTLKKKNPDKKFFPLGVPLVCPDMKRITLEAVRDALEGSGGEHVVVEPAVAAAARHSLEKMLELSR